MALDSRDRGNAFGVIAETDLAVVGGGIAGISAALEASRAGVRAILITDRAPGRSNSIMAQGGIQLPADDDREIELTLSDSVRVGGKELDRQRYRRFVEALPGLQQRLEEWGLPFDRDESGELIRRLAGGLSSPRIATVGDQIGRPLMRMLKDRVSSECEVLSSRRVDDIQLAEGSFSLITEAGSIQARTVVVATGGVAYQEALDTGGLTSNPPNDNASLRSTLEALGLREITPRRFQWHPFGVKDSRKGITLSCVPESVAALGPRLVTTGDGAEVCRLPAPRFEVVEAMKRVIEDGAETKLTLSEIDEHTLAGFPKVERLIRDYGSDPVVVPVIHYELSGYPADVDQSSGIAGLYLAGEIVGGTHGWERLMGAGVADSLVHGSRAGASAARFIEEG